MSLKRLNQEILKFLKENTIKYSEYSSAYGLRSNKNRVQQKGSKPPLGSSDPFFMPAVSIKKKKKKKKSRIKTRDTSRLSDVRSEE